MDLSITVDANDVLANLKSIREDQVPFALSKAINDTALQFQRVELAHIHQAFTLRRPSWIDQSVRITHFAKKTEPWATIGIHPPGGDQRADILGKFEDQTQKTASAGGSLAIPIDVKRNKFDIVTKGQRPRAFQFEKERTNTSTGITIYRGKSRTFMVKFGDGRGWIFKRVGAGAHGSLFEGTQVLYALKPEVAIHANLDFESNAVAVVEGAWHANFEAAYEAALATAR
jgi:hypothetical protein